MAGPQQRLCGERHRELGRQCGGRRHQAVVPDRRCRSQGARAAPLARLDRRQRRRGVHRLLRPAAARRARGVHRRRGVLPLPSAPARGRAHGAAAAADDPLRDAAAQPQRAASRWQRHPPGHRIRPDRQARGLPFSAPPSRRRDRSGSLRRDGAGAGDRGHPRHRSGGCGAVARDFPLRAGYREAVPARPVRRCRARPEEGRGDACAVHHHAGAGRALRHRRERRRRRADDGPAARPDRHAGAGRGSADLGACRCRPDLRAVPVPHAAAGLGGARHSVRVSVERHAEGELLELAARAPRVSPPHRGLPALGHGLADLSTGLGALARYGDRLRRARLV